MEVVHVEKVAARRLKDISSAEIHKRIKKGENSFLLKKKKMAVVYDTQWYSSTLTIKGRTLLKNYSVAFTSQDLFMQACTERSTFIQYLFI